jgi:DNA-binding ferritin-like protein
MQTTPKISPPLHSARGGIGSILNSVLADEYLLHLATHDCHLYANGADATPLRAMLGSQLREIGGRLDRLAWQIGCVGDWTRLGPAELAADGRPGFASCAGLKAPMMLGGLCDLHDELIVRLKTALGMCTDRIGDLDSAAILAELLVLRQRDAWMLGTLRWDLAAWHEQDTWMLPATSWDFHVTAAA